MKKMIKHAEKVFNEKKIKEKLARLDGNKKNFQKEKQMRQMLDLFSARFY